jgi:hypothetical protein
MTKRPWFQKIVNLLGVKAAPAPRQTAELRQPLARLSKHSDFPSKRMRRGVQQAVERAKRPGRLAWIYESCKQAREIRDGFRKRQLVRREVRAQLRAA